MFGTHARTRAAAVLLAAGVGAAVHADTGPAWTNTSNSDEVRSVVAEMLSDAETRSSLLQSGSAGHDGHFYIGDGSNFRLNVSGLLQFRYNLMFGDNLNNVSDRGFESGFQATRTRLQFDGYIYDPALYYKVQGEFFGATNGGGTTAFGLLDAYVGYNFDNGWALQWGQMKTPFSREFLVYAGYQLAANRSIANSTMAGGRAQGIMAKWESDDVRAAFMFSDGFGSLNTDFNSLETVGSVYQGPYSGTADYALTARGEFKFAGDWSQFKDFTSMPGSDYAVMVGVAGHIQGTGEDRITPGPPATDSSTFFAATVDASVEGDGWNLFGAFTGHFSDNLASYNDYSGVVQGGWFIPDSDWELFGRYDVIIPDNDSGARGLATGGTFNTITLGTNYYMHGHASKFTFQFVWFLNANPALTGSNTAVPYLLNGGEKDEFAFTFQWQLMF